MRTFVLSDGSVNSYGFSVNVEKLELGRFRSNPVMLYNHNELVGRWQNLRMEDGKLLGDAEFIDSADEPLAQKIKNRVENGYVKGASLGITILGWEDYEAGKESVAIGEVFECSVCDIPSNANAMVLYDKAGQKLEGEALALTLSRLAKPTMKDTNQKKMKLSKESYQVLNLTESAEVSAIDTAIQQLDRENEDLKAQLATIAEEKVSALIATALKDGRITADKRATFEQLATHDYELAVKTLEALPKTKLLPEPVTPQGAQGRDAWTFTDWRKKDPKGLRQLKAEDPEAYEELRVKSE